MLVDGLSLCHRHWPKPPGFRDQAAMVETDIITLVLTALVPCRRQKQLAIK